MVISVNIDLSKLINGNLYQVPINGEVLVPDEYLKNTDIRKITPVKVKGFVMDNEEEYSLEITISGVMTLACARTLKDVEYPFNIDINEIIDENSDKTLEINQNSLDIFPIIWQNILADVPLRVLSTDAKEEKLEGDGWRLLTEDDEKNEIDPRLADLDKFMKE